MLSTTKTALKAIIGADPTLDDAAKAAILQAVQSPGTTAAPMPRIYSRGDVAKLVGVTTARVDGYARRGLLTRITPPGQSRAIGFSEASVRQLVEG